MAEGFARTYGSDVLEVQSAGLAPAFGIAPLTRKVMLEKNIDLREAFPKGLDLIKIEELDLIINMSGRKLPGKPSDRVVDWKVEDPIGQSEAKYREVADQIEQLVMRLILTLRAPNASEKRI
jgi:arsenate reductase